MAPSACQGTLVPCPSASSRRMAPDSLVAVTGEISSGKPSGGVFFFDFHHPFLTCPCSSKASRPPPQTRVFSKGASPHCPKQRILLSLGFPVDVYGLFPKHSDSRSWSFPTTLPFLSPCFPRAFSGLYYFHSFPWDFRVTFTCCRGCLPWLVFSLADNLVSGFSDV